MRLEALINYIVMTSVLTHCVGSLVSMVPASLMIAIKSQLVMKVTDGQQKPLSPNCTIVKKKDKTKINQMKIAQKQCEDLY